MPLLFVLTLAACASNASRYEQMAAWQRCVDQHHAMRGWLDCE